VPAVQQQNLAPQQDLFGFGDQSNFSEPSITTAVNESLDEKKPDVFDLFGQ